MSSDDARPEVTGETTVTLGDQFKAFYWTAPWLWWTLIGCFLVVVLTSWGGHGDSDSLFNTPVLVGVCVLLWAGTIFFSYWRLSHEQKHVRYRLTTERIEISDGTGAAVTIPWALIKRCVETRSALLFRLKPAGLRWLPKRAFRDVAGMRGLTAQCLGSKAKMRRSE
jgi:YcxB-like protein